MTSAGRVHVIGAGMAGLACAVHLARTGRPVVLYDAATRAGGRCRSFHDAVLDRVIDNGNHVLLSANLEALDYLREIGAADGLTGPRPAAFPFVDLTDGARWVLRPSRGAMPWWLLSGDRRVPGTRASDYLAGLRLATAGPEDRVGDLLDDSTALWRRFWRPLTVAVLNTAPDEASARLLWKVLRATFLRGEAGCRPLVARRGLSATFIDPALAMLHRAGTQVRLGTRLRRLSLGQDRVEALEFGDGQMVLGATDRVVLALPPEAAVALLPGLQAPAASRPIVNAHIRLPAAAALPKHLPFVGLVGGTADWLFARDDVVSLTVSAAGGLVDQPVEAIAAAMWHDTATVLGLDPGLAPPVRVVKERRATFAQTPDALNRRPGPRSAWSNLFLAGDWTDTGYPATIESAVRSGRAAARLALAS